MTTRYVVAYPHPSISPENRGYTCKISAETFTADLIEQLAVRYPEHSDDLNGATFWQASRSLVAQPLS